VAIEKQTVETAAAGTESIGGASRLRPLRASGRRREGDGCAGLSDRGARWGAWATAFSWCCW